MEANRRQLLVTGLGMGAVAALGPRAAALAATRPASQAPLFKISLAEWSLHRTLRAGELDNLDFPAFARERFGIDAVEYVNQFFPDKATDFNYLRELEKRCKDAGVASKLIMIDGEGELADEDDARRRQAVENHFRWIAAAAFLGCHSIRVNAGGGGGWDAQMAHAADSLHRLGEMGERYGINVIVENHGGLSSNGKWLAETIRKADHPRCGTLPDFGNFRVSSDEVYDRYQGVSELMPYAKAVSAKSHEFDAEGNEVNTDYMRMLTIVLDAGYREYLGIEYEGGGLSEVDGVLATKRLLERVRGELSGRY